MKKCLEYLLSYLWHCRRMTDHIFHERNRFPEFFPIPAGDETKMLGRQFTNIKRIVYLPFQYEIDFSVQFPVIGTQHKVTQPLEK